ncbi:MAG: molecular chaperone DnaJ [Candidatus Diapherotrites archaeon]
MAGKDYYSVLGISKNASQEEIKKAYKQMAKKFHPDVSSESNAEQKFKEVNEAYGVLGDETKRKNYDQFGEAGEKFSNFGGFNSGDFSRMDFDFSDLFSGMGFGGFEDLFGGMQRRGAQKGADIVVKLGISFMDAALGTEKEIEIQRIEECEKCHGSGGTGIKNCPQCNGRGMEVKTRKTIFGIFQTQSTCSKCRGEGGIITDPCKECNGQGKLKRKRKIKLNIPEGINSGNHLRLSGQGNFDEGGSGNLFVVILVEPHDVFKRDGIDVFIEVPLSFSEAALGTKIEVPTIKGKAELKVPAGTQTSTLFKMKSQGIRQVNSNNYGDQYVKVFLKTPEKLTKKQKELFEKLSGTEKTRKKRKGFFDKVKEKFS